MKKVLTIGGATQDLLMYYDDATMLKIISKKDDQSFLLVKEGDKVEIKSIHYATGGGATNSAVTFEKFGFAVSSFFKIGTDSAGKFITEKLMHYNINLSSIITDDHEATGISCILPTRSRKKAKPLNYPT